MCLIRFRNQVIAKIIHKLNGKEEYECMTNVKLNNSDVCQSTEQPAGVLRMYYSFKELQESGKIVKSKA